MDWEAVPQWVAAIGTAGALILTSIVFWRQQRDRRAEDAHDVSVWWEVTGDNLVVRLRNTGQRAVYDLKVTIVPSVPEELPEVPEQKPETIYMAAVLAPGASEGETSLKKGGWGWLHAAPDALTVEWELMDSSGRRWKRSRDGDLHQVRHPLWKRRRRS